MVTYGWILRIVIHHHTIYEDERLLSRLYQLLDFLHVRTLNMWALKLAHHLCLGSVLELNKILLNV